MAHSMTINSTPDAINAAYSPIVFNVDSSDGTIVAIRGDVYINGTYATTIDGVQEIGTTNTFNFDVQKIMQDHLTSELRTNITALGLTSATSAACSVKMRFFEILLTGGVHTHTWAADGAGTNYLQSSTYNVVNIALQELESLSDYTVDDPTKQLLTLRTDNCRIPRGVPFQIGVLSSDTNLEVNVLEKNAAGVTLNSYTSGILASLTYGMAIAEIPASCFADPSATHIHIKIVKHLTADRSITYIYKIDDYCDSFPIFFQNHLGGFDHFDFGGNKTENVTTQNQYIKKTLGSIHNNEDRGLSVVSSTPITKINLETGSLSSVEVEFLKEIIRNHSVVYKWNSSGVFLGYVVKSHSTKIDDNVRFLDTLSLTLEPSIDKKVQRGD